MRRSAAPRGGLWATRSLELELRLASELIVRLTNTEGVTRVDVHCEAVEIPGQAGCMGRSHVYLARLQRIGSDVAFVDVAPRADLRRDPSLAGFRRSLAEACVASGATYEIWTEDEIREDAAVANLACVASSSERATLASVGDGRDLPVPAIVTEIGARLGLDGLVPAGTGWVGRSRLTGIPMTLLRGATVDPCGGPMVWRHRPVEAAGSDAGAVPA